MDLATVFGIIGAFGIVIASMVIGGGVGVFINVPSLLIVIVGSMFVVLAKFTVGQFLGAIKICMKAFLFKSLRNTDLIEESVKIADAARKGGILSLESIEISNPFMEKGIQMLVDGHDPDVVKDALKKDMQQTIERHNTGVGFFRALGDVGPAMGMIGTLVGLVQMLSAMEDPKSIGPAMAVALLTTLYGSILANMIALPIADKLQLRLDEERLNQSLIIDALNGIQSGLNPRVIEEILIKYLPSKKRDTAKEE